MGPELLLDYPNDESLKKFQERKEKGMIPVPPGSGGIAYMPRPQEEWTVDNFYNWTDGCVSVKYTEMQDLYSFIPARYAVTIQP